jgi:hypothetical protein
MVRWRCPFREADPSFGHAGLPAAAVFYLVRQAIARHPGEGRDPVTLLGSNRCHIALLLEIKRNVTGSRRSPG